MLQKRKFGKIKFLFKKFNMFLSIINPRYQLSFDEEYFDIKDKDIKYRFKSFGDHYFPEFTFKEIKCDSNILFSVNPHDLIRIIEKNYLSEHLKTQLKIDEFLRKNLYKLSNEQGSNIFSGDEICDNPLLAEQITKSDLFKIAYNTGFQRGRKLSKLVNHENKNIPQEKNVVELKCIINNNSVESP